MKIPAWVIRACRIEEADGPVLMRLAALIIPSIAIISAIQVITYTLFVFKIGMDQLSSRYIFSAVFMIAAGAFAMPRLNRLNPFVAYRLMTLSGAVLLSATALAMSTGHPWAYYLAGALSALLEAICIYVTMSLILASADAARAERVFTPALGFLVLASGIGYVGTGFIVEWINPLTLLTATALFLPATVFLILPLKRHAPAPDEQSSEGGQSAGSFLAEFAATLKDWRSNRLGRTIYFAVLATVSVSVLSDCLYNVVVMWKFTLGGEVMEKELIAFFAFFDAASCIVGVIVYFFVLTPILARLGVARGQVVLPGIFSSGFGLVLIGSMMKEGLPALAVTLGTRLSHMVCVGSLHPYSFDTIDEEALANESKSTKHMRNAAVAQAAFCASGIFVALTEKIPLYFLAGMSFAVSLVLLRLALRIKRLYLEGRDESDDPGAGFTAGRSTFFFLAGVLAVSIGIFGILSKLSFSKLPDSPAEAAVPANAETDTSPERLALADARRGYDETARKLEDLKSSMSGNPLLKSIIDIQNFFETSQSMHQELNGLAEKVRVASANVVRSEPPTGMIEWTSPDGVKQAATIREGEHQTEILFPGVHGGTVTKLVVPEGYEAVVEYEK